jgi:hypothetical protein
VGFVTYWWHLAGGFRHFEGRCGVLLCKCSELDLFLEFVWFKRRARSKVDRTELFIHLTARLPLLYCKLSVSRSPSSKAHFHLLVTLPMTHSLHSHAMHSSDNH